MISGTMAVAAADKAERKTNNSVAAACDDLLAAESCIAVLLFQCSRAQTAAFGIDAVRSEKPSREGDGGSLGEASVCQNDWAAG
jgi:hypothetical protein